MFCYYRQFVQQSHWTLRSFRRQSDVRRFSPRSHNSCGTDPVNLLPWSVIVSSKDNFESDAGMEPVNLFWCNWINSILTKFPISEDSVPPILLLFMSRTRRLVRLKKEFGIVPLRLFLSRSTTYRRGSFEISSDMVPESWLESRSRVASLLSR